MRPAVIIVPGLRGPVPEHWQTWFGQRLPGAREVPPLGRENLACADRVAALEQAVGSCGGPVVLVAHSGGCITVAHWAHATRHAEAVAGVLLVTPPDFERPLPPEYPGLAQLEGAGWLPVPRRPLGFRAIVGASRDDPLGQFHRVAELARDWQAELVDLGPVGHLNPASGHGAWPGAFELLARLLTRPILR